MLKSIFVLSLMLLLTGCSTKPLIVRETKVTAPESKKIFIVSHGWHTGIVINKKLITSLLPELHNRFPNSSHIEFGWGDQGFYQSNEITSGLTVQAIFWPTESVVHTVGFSSTPEIYFPNSEVKSFCLDKYQYSRLVSFIENSFLKNTDGKIIETKNGIYRNSQFYKGEGDYYLMNTCNKWTAKALKSAGLPISTTFKLTADSIFNFLNEHAKNLPVECTPKNTLRTVFPDDY